MAFVAGVYQPQPGDGWVNCRCGNKHWGLFGAAGLLLVALSDSGEVAEFALQHRASFSHEGDTWGTPGGAIMPDETSLAAAIRECQEEIGLPLDFQPAVFAEHLVTHHDWSYTTWLATVPASEKPSLSVMNEESIAVAWQPIAELNQLKLHPAFKNSLPELLELIGNHFPISPSY